MKRFNLFALFAFVVLSASGMFPATVALGVPIMGLGVAVTQGFPDYEASGDNKFIPWIFSKKTVAKFYDKSIAPFTSNTDYEGEIKGMGSKVIINTIPTVTIFDYAKNGTVSWETLESPAVELDIDKAKGFAFRFDKIDLKQFAVKMMDKCSDDAAQQMKIAIDSDYLANIYLGAAAANKGATAGRKSGGYNVGAAAAAIALTKLNITDYIMMCEAIGNEQNWPDTDRWMAIPTWAKFLLDTSELKNASFSGEARSNLLTGGRIGSIGKFTLYETNLYTPVTDTGHSCYNITFGHRAGITFAAQLTETEFHEKFENTFGSGMKGLNVYGYDVIKPEAVGILYAYKG